jgi:hypothetical protein
MKQGSGRESVKMGIYLNSSSSYSKYQETVANPFFVDKSALLNELISCIGKDSKYICITRPRRFGKTVMANMIGSFFAKGVDSSCIFDRLKISESEEYRRHLNTHNVIFIDLSRVPDGAITYDAYIENLRTLVREDLHVSYPDVGFREEGDISEDLERIRLSTGEKFIFVLDEWDAVFHMPFVMEKDYRNYLLFLKSLLKDQAYVELVYMTGILPISKYSGGSELNMFAEYNMATMELYSEYFGFTEDEVERIYKKYRMKTKKPKVSREGLRRWYDGYHTAAGVRMYNPRSVVLALQNNQLFNYWTSSGPYDEVFYYVKNNIADVRDDLALMVSGEAVAAKVQEYAATSINLQTRDEIYSAMVVYGLLTYDDGMVFIPNKELMDNYATLLEKEDSLGYVYQLAEASARMLKATLAGDTETMEEILTLAHDTETPILSYSNEVELSAVVNLVYLSARDKYRVEREDKAGIGYVDFIFYPAKAGDDCILLELKVDHTPEEAIRQIKDRQYALRFKGKLGETPKYTGRILAMGISYKKETKKHKCKVEVLE